jgi:hypothetical protein
MQRLALGVAAALAACALAGPAPARAQTTAVVYPLQAQGVTRQDVSDVHALLEAALFRGARGGGYAPASPMWSQNACGPASTATKECLANVAGAGVVITGVVGRSGAKLVVSLRALDSHGRSFGPVQAMLDPFVQNPAVLTQALAGLQEIQENALAAEARKAAGPGAQASTLPRATRLRVATGPRGAWRRSAGKWTTAIGAALLGGGAAVWAVNQKLANDLEKKYQAGNLTTSDAASYRRVDTFNKVSASMLIVGGVATTTGLLLWGTAPEIKGARGMTLGVSGRF